MRKLFVTFILFFSINAIAIEDNEFFWQPNAKEIVVYTTLHGSSVKAFYKNINNFYLKQSGSIYELGAEYGLSEKIAFGVSTSYRNQEVKIYPVSKNKFEGMGDIDFDLKGRRPADFGNFRYGATYSLSLGKVEVKDGDQNGYSGRSSIIPYIGLDFGDKDITYGGLIGYVLYTGDRELVIEGVESTQSGGETIYLALFTERALPKFINVGAQIQYAKSSDLKSSPSGDVISYSDQFYFAIYGSNPASESCVINYMVGYSYSGPSTYLNSSKGFLGNLGFRFSF